MNLLIYSGYPLERLCFLTILWLKKCNVLEKIIINTLPTDQLIRLFALMDLKKTASFYEPDYIRCHGPEEVSSGPKKASYASALRERNRNREKEK